MQGGLEILVSTIEQIWQFKLDHMHVRSVQSLNFCSVGANKYGEHIVESVDSICRNSTDIYMLIQKISNLKNS